MLHERCWMAEVGFIKLTPRRVHTRKITCQIKTKIFQCLLRCLFIVNFMQHSLLYAFKFLAIPAVTISTITLSTINSTLLNFLSFGIINKWIHINFGSKPSLVYFDFWYLLEGEAVDVHIRKMILHMLHWLWQLYQCESNPNIFSEIEFQFHYKTDGCYNHWVVILVAWRILVTEANCIKQVGR